MLPQPYASDDATPSLARGGLRTPYAREEPLFTRSEACASQMQPPLPLYKGCATATPLSKGCEHTGGGDGTRTLKGTYKGTRGLLFSLKELHLMLHQDIIDAQEVKGEKFSIGNIGYFKCNEFFKCSNVCTEREGVEPSVASQLRRFSKPMH